MEDMGRKSVYKNLKTVELDFQASLKVCNISVNTQG